MRIRRYTGKDAQEAMLKVKMDLGSEAIILSTRKVRKKGIAGLFGKPLTEVLAAIDEEYGNKKETVSNAAKKTRLQTGTYNRQGSIRTLSEDDNRVDSLENRVKQMESMLERIYDNVEKQGNEQKEETPNKKKETERLKENQPLDPIPLAPKPVNAETSEALIRFGRLLSDNDIEQAIIDKMMEKIKQFVKDPGNAEEISSVAQQILKSVLGKPEPIQFRDDGRPTVVLFVGPTGVGKTTTLAKIAADYSLNHQKKVGMITADTYRIAAVEQLKTYAEILNIPVSVIYTPQEIKAAISAYQDKELILIDTAGRSHKNQAQFSELKMLVSAAEADEIYFVLNCTLGRAACREILRHYHFLKKYKLLFTKLDEALVPGVILNVRYATGKPLSYTTAGQSVPDDIELANVDEIAKSILQW